MSYFKRILAVMALTLGVVGALACIALIVGSIVVNSRLRKVANAAYTDVDDLFVQAKDRVHQVDKVVDRAKITTSDLKESLKSWTNRAAEEHVTQELNERFKLEAKTSDLAITLAKADSFVEMSADSMSLVLKAVEMANQSGANIDAEGLESLQQDTRQLRDKLGEAIDDVTNLSSRLRDADNAAAPREWLAAAAELAVRVIATLEVVQSGLQQLEDGLAESRRTVAETEPRLVGWIHLASAIVILLSLWTLAGQFALGRSGWTRSGLFSVLKGLRIEIRNASFASY